MAKVIPIIISFFFISLPGAAQSDSAVKAAQILKIEQSLMDALPGDTTVWSKYLADNWYIITEDGTGFHKKEFLAGFAPFPKGYSGHINITKPIFTFFRNTAVVHYVADEYEEVYSQQLHTTYATVNTYYNEGNDWNMIGSQIFEVPQLPKPIKIPVETLQKYTGTYRLTDTISCVIGIENGHLFIQKKNRKKETLESETADIFFRQSDTRGRKIFIRNGSGNMLMLERRNGNDLTWKRIE